MTKQFFVMTKGEYDIKAELTGPFASGVLAMLYTIQMLYGHVETDEQRVDCIMRGGDAPVDHIMNGGDVQDIKTSLLGGYIREAAEEDPGVTADAVTGKALRPDRNAHSLDSVFYNLVVSVFYNLVENLNDEIEIDVIEAQAPVAKVDVVTTESINKKNPTVFTPFASLEAAEEFANTLEGTLYKVKVLGCTCGCETANVYSVPPGNLDPTNSELVTILKPGPYVREYDLVLAAVSFGDYRELCMKCHATFDKGVTTKTKPTRFERAQSDYDEAVKKIERAIAIQKAREAIPPMGDDEPDGGEAEE